MSLTTKMLVAISAVGVVCVVSSCERVSADPERNIIVDKQPFYRHEAPYRPGSEAEIIMIVQAFASEHGMDYLGGPGHPTLGPGEFNLTAAGKTLNFGVSRILAASPDILIVGFSIGDPTPDDKKLAREFVCRLERNCEAE